MTTLVVQLPPRDAATVPGEWELPALPFVYFDGNARRLRSGVSSLAQLPGVDALVLLFAPSDVLLLRAAVPPVSALRLRQALPNLVEDQLVQDAARCHLAVSPETDADGKRVIAAVDRAWMRFVLESFGADTGRRVRAIPLITCLPEAEGDEGVLTIVEGPGSGAEEKVEVVVEQGALPYGFAVPRAQLLQTIKQLEHGQSLQLRYVEALPGVLSALTVGLSEMVPRGAKTIGLDAVAARALHATLDLCQFEFATQRWQGVRTVARRWRVPIALAAACVAVCIIGLNLQWLFLSRDHAALAGHAEELLREAFPKTTVVLDAPLQMTRNLETLRATAGELAPSDFLFMTGRLGEATGQLPAGSVAALDYSDRALAVTFRPGFVADGAVGEALRLSGYTIAIDGQKWLIKSASK